MHVLQKNHLCITQIRLSSNSHDSDITKATITSDLQPESNDAFVETKQQRYNTVLLRGYNYF